MANPMSSDANPAARARALDGEWYSFDEFIQQYGPTEGERIWDQARADPQRCYPIGSDAHPVVLALALDGEWYALDEFIEQYGPTEGKSIWDQARADPHRCGVFVALSLPDPGKATYPVAQAFTPGPRSAQQDAAGPARPVASVTEIAAAAGPAHPTASSAAKLLADHIAAKPIAGPAQPVASVAEIAAAAGPAHPAASRAAKLLADHIAAKLLARVFCYTSTNVASVILQK